MKLTLRNCSAIKYPTYTRSTTMNSYTKQCPNRLQPIGSVPHLDYKLRHTNVTYTVYSNQSLLNGIPTYRPTIHWYFVQYASPLYRKNGRVTLPFGKPLLTSYYFTFFLLYIFWHILFWLFIFSTSVSQLSDYYYFQPLPTRSLPLQLTNLPS